MYCDTYNYVVRGTYILSTLVFKLMDMPMCLAWRCMYITSLEACNGCLDWATRDYSFRRTAIARLVGLGSGQSASVVGKDTGMAVVS